MPDHGHHSHLIVKVCLETGRRQPLDPGEVLGVSVEQDGFGEQQRDPTGQLPLIVGRQFGENVGEEGPLYHFHDELAIALGYRRVSVPIVPWEEAVGISLGGERSEEHTSELQSLAYLVCRLLLEKKKKKTRIILTIVC